MLGDPKSSEDIPSYKDLAQGESLKRIPKSMYPEGVYFEKKTVLLKRSYVGIALIVIGFVVMLVGAIMSPKIYYAPSNHWSDSWTIKPGEEWYHTWTIKTAEGFLEINATVSGGNNDLRIYVDTPKGRVDFGKLQSPIHVIVNFSKYGPGEYTIHYDNRFSLITSKVVNVAETAYRRKEDTSDKDVLESLGLFLVVLGFFLSLSGFKKRGFLYIDDDVVEATYENSRIELKVNDFKLDQKVDHSIKFKAGRDESRIIEIEKVGSWWKGYQWIFKVDGQEVGRLP